MRKAALRSAFALAAAVLVAVAVPAAYLGDRALAPAGSDAGPRGLPDRWYATSLALPTVRTWPMVEASLLLTNYDMTRYVVVSADGTRYARIPGKTVMNATLSPDGRRVAWVEWISSDDHEGGRNQAILHDLRLSDGSERTQVMTPQTLLLNAIRYVGDDVHLGFGANGKYAERVATFDDRGTLTPAGVTGPAVDAARGDIRNPDGSLYAQVSAERVRIDSTPLDNAPKGVGVHNSWPLPAGTRSAFPLAWTRLGLVLRLEAQGGATRDLFSIAVLDWESGRLETISTTDTAWSPVSAASGLVRTGGTVQAAPPVSPRWHTDVALWVWRQNRIALVTAVTVLLGAGPAIGFVVRRRRAETD
ncbi:hypothetical protein ACIB24_04415 [Spongisporangium articulatum]|uniref:Uncharacterized protein n=1 Tax=Spongisporangium articulatum TaxID=3362603 RepID=A0ABW8AJV7_9ACTN